MSASPNQPSPHLRLPRIGDPAPNVTLPTTDGEIIHLAEYSKPIVLVFLRHLA